MEWVDRVNSVSSHACGPLVAPEKSLTIQAIEKLCCVDRFGSKAAVGEAKSITYQAVLYGCPGALGAPCVAPANNWQPRTTASPPTRGRHAHPRRGRHRQEAVQFVTNDARCRSREVFWIDFDCTVGEDEQEQVDRRGYFLTVVHVGLVEEAVTYEGAHKFVVYWNLYDAPTGAQALPVEARAGCG